jgi:hypothetical protein
MIRRVKRNDVKSRQDKIHIMSPEFPMHMQVEPITELRFVDIFVQHRPDSEGAAQRP